MKRIDRLAVAKYNHNNLWKIDLNAGNLCIEIFIIHTPFYADLLIATSLFFILQDRKDDANENINCGDNCLFPYH